MRMVVTHWSNLDENWRHYCTWGIWITTKTGALQSSRDKIATPVYYIRERNEIIQKHKHSWPNSLWQKSCLFHFLQPFFQLHAVKQNCALSLSSCRYFLQWSRQTSAPSPPTLHSIFPACSLSFVVGHQPIKSSGQFSKCSFTMMHLFYLSFTTRGNPWESYRANAFEWMVQETIQLQEYETDVWRCEFDNWGKLTPAHRAGAPSGWVRLPQQQVHPLLAALFTALRPRWTFDNLGQRAVTFWNVLFPYGHCPLRGGAEAQKPKTFRVATFYAQKLSRRSARNRFSRQA